MPKSFKNENNPALQFISTQSENAQDLSQDTYQDSNVPMKLNPLYIETKSKRINLLMQPSLHKKLKKIAEKKRTSFNDLVHTILDEYTKNN